MRVTLCQGQSPFWFWLTVLQDILWWPLPYEVGLTLASIITVAGLLMCLMFDIVAPKDQPHYVPKKRCKRRNILSTGLFNVLDQGATIIMERINNLKIKRRSRPLKLCYSGYRPKCKSRRVNMPSAPHLQA